MDMTPARGPTAASTTENGTILGAMDMVPTRTQMDSCTKGASNRGNSMDGVFWHALIVVTPDTHSHMKATFPMTGSMGEGRPHFQIGRDTKGVSTLACFTNKANTATSTVVSTRETS